MGELIRLPRRHELKTWPKHFSAVYDGAKAFEFRYNDRDFCVGDTLILREWEPRHDYKRTFGGTYTGRAVEAAVTYILREYEELPEFVADNYVVMSIELMARKASEDASWEMSR